MPGRVFAILCLLLLVALPVGITLARDDRFESRIELVTVAGQPELQRLTIPTDLNAYVARLASRKRVTDATARRAGFPIDGATVAENTRVAPGDGPDSVFLVTSETTPERARELADVLARRVVLEPRRDSEQRARERLQALLARAEEGGLSKAERASIEAGIDEAAAVIRVVGSQPALHRGRASTPSVTAPMDKFVDSLPGALPPRPSPFWAGLIGLILAGSILAAWLVLRDAWPAGLSLKRHA